MEERIIELETRLAFQDDLLQTLNQLVTDQARQIERLELSLQSLSERLATLSEGGGASRGSLLDERPPHY